MTYRFELAEPNDDAGIRFLLRQNAVPGQMKLTYEREPDYFLGCSVMGHTCQTLVARHQESNQIAGLASRSIRATFINGQVEQVGYIGQLRVAEAHRSRWIVPLGFRFFHELHQDGNTTGYFTTIIDGNREATGLLVDKPRRHYPAYRPVGRLYTLALILRKSPFPSRNGRPSGPGAVRLWRWLFPKRAAPSPGGHRLEIRTGSDVGVQPIVDFLQREGKRKQFFPLYTATDLLGDRTRDFQLNDLHVALDGTEIAGVMGLWNQEGFKQTVVRDYGPLLEWPFNVGAHSPRKLYNLASRLIGAQPLTEIDQAIHFAYASFVCVRDNDPAIFQQLLARTYNQAVDEGYAYLMLGLMEHDPLLSVARRWLHLSYTSTLYTVCWEENEDWYRQLDGRIPYVEISTL